MPWLRLQPGQVANLELREASARRRTQHWVDGRSVECAGNGCPYCAGGSTPKTVYSLQVTWEGSEYTWEMSEAVWRQFCELLPDAARRIGAVVRLKRIGSGPQTRYDLELVRPVSPAQDTAQNNGKDTQAILVPFTLEDVRKVVHEELLGQDFGQMIELIVLTALENWYADAEKE